jgi:hypothetical protein
MADLPAQVASNLQSLVETGLAEYRERKMSPAEAWRAATKRAPLEKLSPGFAPIILGKELAHCGFVSDKLLISVKDAETGEKYTVAAVIGGKPLERGLRVLVWINPMDCGKAYVADMQGRFLGVAKVMFGVRADADASIAELQDQLGIRSAALAEERKRLKPHVKARLQERADAMAANVAALGIDDPVEIVDAERRKAIELEDAVVADVDFSADLIDNPAAEENSLKGVDFDNIP